MAVLLITEKEKKKEICTQEPGNIQRKRTNFGHLRRQSSCIKSRGDKAKHKHYAGYK